jgi:hypothetical protein
VGRRLDFLMQELNREANTLASKAGSLDLTNASVDLKVLIEQMREQIQNVEEAAWRHRTPDSRRDEVSCSSCRLPRAPARRRW